MFFLLSQFLLYVFVSAMRWIVHDLDLDNNVSDNPLSTTHHLAQRSTRFPHRT